MVSIVLGFGCSDLADVELLHIDADGSVSGFVYRDGNGTRQFDQDDAVAVGVGIELRAEAGQTIVIADTTDLNGQFQMVQVDVGSYDVVVDPAVVGDSLVTFGLPALLTVRPQTDTVIQIGLTYPLVSIPEARASAPGRRVFVEGIALNRLRFPGDRVAHISTGEGFLRLLNVTTGNPAVGDSVRVLGSTAEDGGSPVLTEAAIFGVQGSVRFPLPEVVSTGDADDSLGGALDAALVEVRNAVITSVSQGSDSFWVVANDGSGAVRIRLKDFLGFNTGAFTAGRTIGFARGLLAPSVFGGGRWDLAPRDPSDIQTLP